MGEFVRSTAEYNQREAVIETLRAGRSSAEIIGFFGYPRSTGYDIAQKYAGAKKSVLSSVSSARHNQEKVARIPSDIQRAQELISKDLLPLRKLSITLRMRRIAEKDLRYTFYVFKAREMLHEATKVKRVATLKHEASGLRDFFR